MNLRRLPPFATASLAVLSTLGLGACQTMPGAASAPASVPPQASALAPGRLDGADVGRQGLVSAADARAADAGAQMLRQGGSATDAALATMLALTVVEPQSSGIGGGGFLVMADAAGQVDTVDGREKAPAAATPQWFFKDGQPMAFPQARPGGRSVGVPGSLRLAALAHAEHGKLAWRMLFAPAIKLARDGFAITPRLYRALSDSPEIAGLDPAGRALFYGADGRPLPVGTVVRNPALADTLEALAARGADWFYSGANAQAIATKVGTAPVNPAPLTTADLAAFKAVPRPAVCGKYRQYRICSMGPPSSGATTVLATLGQLERFDLTALGPDSPVAWHLLAESERLAYADRDQYLADPDFVSVPVAGLTDPAYLAQRSQLISAQTALPRVTAGVPAGVKTALAPARAQPEFGTSHFVTVDRWGNVASYTSTVESAFGSGLMANGYFLNNELTDFNLDPMHDGQPTANRVEGGKRPRSSMSPTVVYGPDGQVRLVVGAAGGATIPAQVIRALIGVLDWHLTAQQALALPVLFAPGERVCVEQGSRLETMIPTLVAMGHAQAQACKMPLKANAIERVGNRWLGAADPRSEGAAIAQ
ncbi:gamma-glutamyltransferase [Novosphingobium sp. SG720]|uniref:gamma-glutamyltransferase n=1 Tax=Novosphingobium TaxID=165696 RepID=UPI0017EDB66F|nr:gamma-glutamyltransferase [Novosphingobium sp. SG720]NKJ42498.1 gamma-glutamyltranspeptidase/glutathione hydrolase [Novosphingobium sp. SG720]